MRVVFLKEKPLLILILLLTVAFGFSARNHFGQDHSFNSAQNLSRWLIAKPNLSQLRYGDLIFRHGRGIISNVLITFGRSEKKYSHAGIVSVENGNVFVYHAIGGEENISNKLRKDPLADFCNPADAHAFGVYRTGLDDSQINSVMILASTYYKNGLQFDTKFDLSTDDKMYCTEFVYKIFKQALGNENYISLSTINGKQYIACDDLYCNAHCREIYHYQY